MTTHAQDAAYWWEILMDSESSPARQELALEQYSWAVFRMGEDEQPPATHQHRGAAIAVELGVMVDDER